MIFDALILREWARRPLQTLLSVLAIAVGVASTTAAELTRSFDERAVRASVFGSSTEAALQIAGVRGTLADTLPAALADVPGIAELRPIVDADVVVRAGATARVVSLEGLDAMQSFPGSTTLRTYAPGPFAPPQPLDLALTSGNGAVVSAKLARDLDARVGSHVRTSARGSTRELVIAAVLPDATLGLDPNAALVDISTAQALLSKRGALTRVDVVVNPTASARAVRRAIAARLPASARVVEPELRLATLERDSAGFSTDLSVLAVLASALAVLLVATALGLAVRRRAPDVATLRALGASRSAIARAFLVEGAVLGVAGAIVGALAGHAITRLAGGAGGVGNAATGAERAADLAALVRAGAVGVALSMVAACVPALRAAAIAPAHARGTAERPARRRMAVPAAVAGVTLGAAGPFLIGRSPVAATLAIVAGFALLGPLALGLAPLAARLARTPAAWLALQNLRPAARRASLAIAVLATAIAASVATASAATTFRSTVARWIAASMPGDLIVRPETLASPRLERALERRLARVPGVAGVAPSRRFEVPFRGEIMGVRAFDSRTLAMRGLPLGDGDAAVSRDAARRLGLHVGDAVALGPGVPLVVRAIDDDVASLADGFTVDTAAGAAIAGDTDDDAIALTVRPGASLEGVRARALATAAPLALDVTTAAQTRAAEESAFARPLRLGEAIGWAALVVAIASSITTTAATVAERRRELVVLRMVGLSRRGLRTMIAWEAACVALVAAILGTAAGLALGASLVTALDPAVSGATLRFVVPWQAIALAWSAVLGAAIVSGPLVGGLGAGRVSSAALDS